MRTTPLVLALCGALIGCGSQPPTRTITGQLRVDTTSMSKPVVMAQSADHRVFIAEVASSGRFTLTLPTDVSYRLTLASTTSKAGIYSAAARINWPLSSGASRWATVGNGTQLDLGNVYRRGTKPPSANTSGGQSGDKGDCKQDDSAGCQSHSSDYDCDCDHKSGGGDHCDKDDDGDGHDQSCDDDDHHKCNHDGDGGDDGDDEGGGDHHHECDGGSSPAPTPGKGSDGGMGTGSGGGTGTGTGTGGSTGSGGIN